MKFVLTVIITMICGSASYSQTSEAAGEFSEGRSFELIGRDLSFGIVHMSQSDEFAANGPTFGLGVAAKIGKIENSDIYLEWNSTFARGTDNSSDTRYQGSDPLVFAAGTSPVGTIDLSTAIDALGASSDATAQIIDSTGDTAMIVSSAFSPSAPDTAVSQFALSQTMSGGIFAALSTNGETGLASAYGTIFDDTGFVFLGTGEDAGTAIRSSFTDKISYVSHSLFLSAGFPIDDRWTLTPRIGPTYRSFDRTSKASTIIDINEGFDLAPPVPDINLSETISLESTYLGAILGATVSGRIRDDWQLSIGAEAGLANFDAEADSLEGVRIANVQTSISGRNLTLDGTSGIGRLSAGLTHVGPGGAIISLNAFVDYMSDVPYVAAETIAAPTVAADGTTTSFEGTGQTYRTHSMKQKEMISSGISLSVVVLF